MVEWRSSRSLQSRVVATHILGQVELAKRCTLLCVFPGKKTIQPNQTRVRNPDPILASLSSLYLCDKGGELVGKSTPGHPYFFAAGGTRRSKVAKKVVYSHTSRSSRAACKAQEDRHPLTEFDTANPEMAHRQKSLAAIIPLPWCVFPCFGCVLVMFFPSLGGRVKVLKRR